MFPNEWIDQLRGQLGESLEDFLRAEEAPPALALRVNSLRPSAFDAAKPYIEDPVPWADHGFYLKQDAKPGSDPLHDLGAFYLQEASAMISASLLDAKPGERILDLCAAPGGKSTQIADSMRGRGLLMCNEPIQNRAKILGENLERMGIVNAVAVCAYPNQLAEKWPDYFDKVLVDAPCSGEGMFRRNPNAAKTWTLDTVTGCARRQAEILDSAAKLVRPGGTLVYSTCTFNMTEDEDTIESFLNRHPEFSSVDFFLPALGKSQNGMIKIWPHLQRGDGHFAAKLVKAGDDRIPSAAFPGAQRLRHSDSAGMKIKKNAKKGKSTGKKTIGEGEPHELVSRLERETCLLPECLDDGWLIRQGDYIHLLPADTPSLDGIRTIKPGLCLLRAGRSHVEPSHALGRACLPLCEDREVPAWMGGARRWICMDDADYAALKTGRRLEGNEPGWTLVLLHGIPALFYKQISKK